VTIPDSNFPFSSSAIPPDWLDVQKWSDGEKQVKIDVANAQYTK